MQPICEARTLKIHHYELLLRNIEDMSLHGKVIQDAESSGFIPLLDFFALTSAVESLQNSQTIRLSVNVSPVTIDTVADEFLARIPLDSCIASRLTVEMTETRVPDMDKARAFREKLGERGITFSIDDFGPAHSMNHGDIMALCPDEIKLSGSAVERAVRGDPTHIDLALATRATVVAECIDSTEKLEYVRKREVALVQGYIINHR